MRLAAGWSGEIAPEHLSMKRAHLSSPSNLDVRDMKQEACDGAACERTQHRDGRITPVGAALARNGKNSVGDTWAEIAGGIDGVASCSTK